MSKIGDAKRKEKLAKEEAGRKNWEIYKARKRRERKCFWTKPWGHVYTPVGKEQRRSTGDHIREKCVACGKGLLR